MAFIALKHQGKEKQPLACSLEELHVSKSPTAPRQTHTVPAYFSGAFPTSVRICSTSLPVIVHFSSRHSVAFDQPGLGSQISHSQPIACFCTSHTGLKSLVVLTKTTEQQFVNRKSVVNIKEFPPATRLKKGGAVFHIPCGGEIRSMIIYDPPAVGLGLKRFSLVFVDRVLLHGNSRRGRTPSSARLSPGSKPRCPPWACGTRIRTA